MTATEVRLGDPTVQTAEEVADALGVDLSQGLSDEEAARRLAADGPNELRARPPTPLWRKVIRQFQDPLVYLLLVAIAISLLAWVGEGTHSLPVDAIVIALIVVANAVLGLVQEEKAESAVAALASMTAATSTVVRGGRLLTVPSRDVVRGDLLSLSEGDSVGADGRLVTASGLRLQEASLTGESDTTVKTPAPLDAPAALGDRRNMVHGGTAVVQGVGRAVVTSTGMHTEMGAIAELLDRTEQEPSPLQREIATVSKTLGLAVIAIAVVVMVAIGLLNGIHSLADAVTVLLMGVSLAVAAVPEGLPAILSVVLALGVRAMARDHAVMKDLHSVETLGSASVICSDKTGTLTRNEMTLTRIITPTGSVELTGVGYQPHGEAHYTATRGQEDDLLAEARRVVVAGALANNAELREEGDEWTIQGDPTEAAFLVALHKLDARGRVARYEREAEVPFTSQRKMMSILGHDRTDDVHRLFVKGAPDVLLEHCESIRVGDQVVPLDAQHRNGFLTAVEQLSAEAFRTLGVAYRDVDVAVLPTDDEGLHSGVDESVEAQLVLLGVVGIIDPPRDEAKTAVAEAHRAGIRTVMITGDHPGTAARIARDLGIASASGPGPLSGNDLDALDDAGLGEAVLETTVYARVAPEHKLRIVDALQSHGLVVAMTGDGVNDAPALKSADIGIAMGINGTEVTKESARMILADDNYATIVDAVRQGRVIFDNIKKFLRYLLSSNLGEVATVFFGVVLASAIGLSGAGEPGEIVLPLLATQILWINLVTDSAPALAMGVDPEIDDVMGRPPRQQSDRILDRAMWLRVAYIGLVMAAVTLLTMDMTLPGGLVEGSGSLELARTAGFTTLVLAQLFNAFNSRSAHSSAFRDLGTNPWLWAAVGLGLVLQVAVVELPFLQTAFGTVSLDLSHWLLCLGMSSVVLWAEELSKLVRRRLRARARP